VHQDVTKHVADSIGGFVKELDEISTDVAHREARIRREYGPKG
jgi:hypothetical protein